MPETLPTENAAAAAAAPAAAAAQAGPKTLSFVIQYTVNTNGQGKTTYSDIKAVNVDEEVAKELLKQEASAGGGYKKKRTVSAKKKKVKSK